MNRRYALTGIGTLLLGGIARASSLSETGNSATFVLVHGAWHGGWCWKKVAALLRKEGFVVYTPTLSGLGERSHQLGPEIDLDVHIQDIVNVLEYEDLHHVILVGHSYAGMVITGVAGKAGNRIDQLVYLDAFLPENGKSLSDYVPAAPAENAPEDSDSNWKVPPLDTPEGFGVKDPADQEWTARRLGPQPAKTFRQPLTLQTDLPATIRKSYVLLTEDSPWFLEAAARAKAKGYMYHRLIGGGHDAMISEPEKIAGLFGRIAGNMH